MPEPIAAAAFVVGMAAFVAALLDGRKRRKAG